MKINSIAQFYQPSFKSNITFDIGGSQREGSCKISYTTSDNSAKIYEAKTTVNSLGKKQFVDSNDFVNKIVEKVNTIQKNNVANVCDMGYDASENTIKSMTIFIPSYTSYRHVFYLPNHKDSSDRPLKDIDFSNIEELLKDSKVLVDPNMRFRVFQDSMGTGLAVAKKLYNNDLLSKGKYYTACITGGGCGVANIEMGLNIISMALMILPGGVAAAGGWVLKGALLAKNVSTGVKVASSLNILNKVVKVLVDGPSKNNPEFMTGYSEHRKVVNFKPINAKVGDIVNVKITEAKTWFMNGEQIDE